MKIKKTKKIKDEQIPETKAEGLNEELIADASMDEAVDVNTIEEFIEIKKLQNRLLEKMIMNLNDKENTDKQ